MCMVHVISLSVKSTRRAVGITLALGSVFAPASMSHFWLTFLETHSSLSTELIYFMLEQMLNTGLKYYKEPPPPHLVTLWSRSQTINVMKFYV